MNDNTAITIILSTLFLSTAFIFFATNQKRYQAHWKHLSTQDKCNQCHAVIQRGAEHEKD
jgi:preprotein translocase subunit SecG